MRNLSERLPFFQCFCFVFLPIYAIFAHEMKITKRRYLEGFLAVTLLLALVRCIFPSVAAHRPAAGAPSSTDSGSATDSDAIATAEASRPTRRDSIALVRTIPHRQGTSSSRFFHPDGSLVKNRILSVPGYSKSFPDQQDVQFAAANKWGVSPVTDREEAERRKAELVYVGSNPYFHVDKLRNSIPYLVPRASVLLQDIGRNFFDSLQIKGIPLHKLIVTSVLRSKSDVEKLRGHNGNATQNSCHLYGTTFDVCYNRYKTVEALGTPRRAVRNDTLKYVLAEVLRDMRESGRCYIKYEVKQGCFHITVR